MRVERHMAPSCVVGSSFTLLHWQKHGGLCPSAFHPVIRQHDPALRTHRYSSSTERMQSCTIGSSRTSKAPPTQTRQRGIDWTTFYATCSRAGAYLGLPAPPSEPKGGRGRQPDRRPQPCDRPQTKARRGGLIFNAAASRAISMGCAA